MVGTIASRTTASIRPAPPRGITTSTRPRAWIRWVTLARSALGSSCTASTLRVPRSTSASRSAVTSAAFELRRRRAAAQQHRVAGLERQPERVDRHVGPALVDDADHTERNPLLTQLKPVGQRAAAQHLADRVGQARDLTQPGGDAVDALRVQRQPVEHRLRRACGLGSGQILGVGGQDARVHGSTLSAAACSARFFVSVLSVANSRAATRARRAASCTCSRKSETRRCLHTH